MSNGRNKGKRTTDATNLPTERPPDNEAPQQPSAPRGATTKLKRGGAMAKLTPKQRIFVNAKVRGLSSRSAALKAGSPNPRAADQYGQQTLKKVEVQAAIDAALEASGATPEFAVGVLKQVAEQTEELGARRLAAKDILELHGWNKAMGNNVQLNIKQGFFKVSRQEDD